METAIRTIAQGGYSRASLAEIARKAGVSKGVISYHFQGKEDLFEEVLRNLLREPAAFVKERVGQEKTMVAKLRSYVGANFEFMSEHREAYVALVDLWGSHGVREARQRFHVEAYEPSRHYLSHILEQGQVTGELRDLPTRTVASLIQAAIDGAMLQWVFDPDSFDLQEMSGEVQEMVSAYIVKRQGRQEQRPTPPHARRPPIPTGSQRKRLNRSENDEQ